MVPAFQKRDKLFNIWLLFSIPPVFSALRGLVAFAAFSSFSQRIPQRTPMLPSRAVPLSPRTRLELLSSCERDHNRRRWQCLYGQLLDTKCIQVVEGV